MEIVLEVTQSPAGRLSGTVRAAGHVGQMAFSGVMELLACIEELCAREATVPLPSQPVTQDEAPGAWPGQPATAEERKFSHVQSNQVTVTVGSASATRTASHHRPASYHRPAKH